MDKIHCKDCIHAVLTHDKQQLKWCKAWQDDEYGFHRSDPLYRDADFSCEYAEKARKKLIEKKILPEYYHSVRINEKTFELRKDDSDYRIGDVLVLKEWDGKNYTGNLLVREITYILRDVPQYGLMEGYCILGIQPIKQ